MDMMNQQQPQGNPQDGGLMMEQPGQPMMPQGPQMPGQGMGDPSQGQPQGPAGMQPDQEQGESNSQDMVENYIDFAMEQANLATKFEEELPEMAESILGGIQQDIRSREAWMEKNTEWLKLALLIKEIKSFPWIKASNVKYPLIATAAMQFSARAYPDRKSVV